MRWLTISYLDLLALPAGYIEVAVAMAQKEAREARAQRAAAKRSR